MQGTRVEPQYTLDVIKVEDWIPMEEDAKKYPRGPRYLLSGDTIPVHFHMFKLSKVGWSWKGSPSNPNPEEKCWVSNSASAIDFLKAAHERYSNGHVLQVIYP